MFYCSNANMNLMPCDFLGQFECRTLKGAASQFVHLETFSLNVSSLPFAICLDLLHPLLSLFFFGYLLNL